MKKLLKRICLFICVTITLSMAVMPIATLAAEDLGISVSDAAGAPGETVSVDINIGNNPGFNALNVAVVYDSANLAQTGVQNNVSALYMTAGSSLVWDGAENYTGTGSLATVTFSIAPNAQIGEYEIKLVFWGASNADFEEVSATVSAGKITVICKHTDTTPTPEEPASCNRGGYTAGVYCNTCKTYISGHEPTNPTGQHVDADGAWEKDDAKHWHTCACGQIFGSEGHSGGTATCIAKAVCSACGKEYGTVNKENHAGKTTVINATAADHNTQTPG